MLMSFRVSTSSRCADPGQFPYISVFGTEWGLCRDCKRPRGRLQTAHVTSGSAGNGVWWRRRPSSSTRSVPPLLSHHACTRMLTIPLNNHCTTNQSFMSNMNLQRTTSSALCHNSRTQIEGLYYRNERWAHDLLM